MSRTRAVRSKDNTTFVGRRIGEQLNRLREASGTDVMDLDRSGFMSRQTIWRLQGGQGPYKETTIRALCQKYGAGPEHVDKLLEMAARWRENSFHEPYGSRFGLYLETEQEAEAITVLNESVINGLLQTRDYHRGQCALIPPPNDVELEIELRRQRQALFFERDDVHLSVVMTELALTYEIGSPQVMREQIKHLQEIAERPNVSIRYIRPNHAHQGMAFGPFTLMKIDDSETIVYMESFNGSQWVSDPKIVSRYQSVAGTIIGGGTTDIRERAT